MGDGRINRWLIHKDDALDGEALWLELVKFLEKELKICQQKAVIFSKNPDNQPKDPKDPKDTSKPGNQKSYHGSTGPNSSPRDITVCFVCGESDHVQTVGPGGMKLVQYFVCKKWAEMSNLDRLKTLKSKGFCCQCLFPGADATKEKHATGRCQRDFVCKHSS